MRGKTKTPFLEHMALKCVQPAEDDPEYLRLRSRNQLVPMSPGLAVVQWTSGVWLLHTCSHLIAPPPPKHIQTEMVGVSLKSLLLLEYSANSVVSMLLRGSIDSAGLSEQQQTPFSVHPSSFSEQSLQNAIYRLILFKSTFSKKKKYIFP